MTKKKREELKRRKRLQRGANPKLKPYYADAAAGFILAFLCTGEGGQRKTYHDKALDLMCKVNDCQHIAA